MSSDQVGVRAHLKRVPQQERSQVRFELIIAEAMRLFGELGYEAISMREIARAAEVPIASVYQYFPTKQAIVKEIWLRFSQTVREQLSVDLAEFVAQGGQADPGRMIAGMVDLMASVQLSSPAYVEVWGCVAASPELRTLNDEDTLASAELIVAAIMAVHPRADADLVEGMVLVLSLAIESITKLSLSLGEAQRETVLRQTKRTLTFLFERAVGEGRE